MTTRVGVFGGTFDPPHVGHLLAASDAAEALTLDRVVWIPAAQQPFKAGQPAGATAVQRLAMVRRAIAGDPRFLVDAIEVDRGGLSYMVDTLRQLTARDPSAEWYLLLGADAARGLPRWREPEVVQSLARIVVLTRVGEVPYEPVTAHASWRVVTTRRCDVSATEIRARIAAGRSVRGFVTDAVADYIRSVGLYRVGG
ncbi:MAG: nicotinate-nucleotide adenylyltransferase [Gemmatimonadaceae bacterium]|nr:nicotinate-nucleotide adenylyltransferase [Gemmatimonadaceae bacterium]